MADDTYSKAQAFLASQRGWSVEPIQRICFVGPELDLALAKAINRIAELEAEVDRLSGRVKVRT